MFLSVQYSVRKLLSSHLISETWLLLYGCEKWYLTLREEHEPENFENKLFRKIFGTNDDEISEQF